MATTTTNFGWDIPQSTDLVKDGATAIAALGQDIDTALVDLKGGTSGQILSKASGTDLDYTWITNDVGDITAVTAGTGITGGGTSGDVTVSFDQANFGGGQWAAGKNKIINGDFGINQRNFTSTTTTGEYGFDRWALNASDGTTTYSTQSFTPGAAPVAGYESKNFARIVSTGQTLTSANSFLVQRIEDVRTLAGQTATISFWAKAASGTPSVAVEFQQNFGSGGSPSATVNTYAGKTAITTSWTRYSITIAIPSISGKTFGTTENNRLICNLWTSAGSDFNSRTGSLGIQSATIDFWGVQVEATSTASPFQTATGTKQGELAACQRYYFRSVPSAYQYYSNGSAISTTIVEVVFPLPVQMRVYPTSLDNSQVAVNDGVTISAGGTSTLIGSGNLSRPVVRYTHGSAALTQYRPYFLADSGLVGYIGFSAEL